ncbi:uncharacterized protein [Typha latifolia]|uniref:uncharacterized protein n=1 Tax=Typha latifolia TaxID=4733 RepID=UPI003C2D3A2D
MEVVKSSPRVSGLDGDFCQEVRGTPSSPEEEEEDEDKLRAEWEDSSGLDSSSEIDSGMETDELEISEIGEAGTELCQVGNQSCSIPLELYDLPDLGGVLSLETWNNCLSEEERFALSQYLPDMDQETFAWTLTELFSGKNFHFGSPLSSIFERLKGGLCDPRNVLYRRGLKFLQSRRHYHYLRKYQNSMVGSLNRIRDAWQNCKGYGIEERLRFLNILRNQRSLGFERDGDVESSTDLESEDSDELFQRKWSKIDRWRRSYDSTGVEKMKFGKEDRRGELGVATQKASSQKDYIGAGGRYSSAIKHGTESKTRYAKVAANDFRDAQRARQRIGVEDDYLEEQEDENGLPRDWNASCGSAAVRATLPKPLKLQELARQSQRGMYGKGHVGSPYFQGESRRADQAVTVASYDPQYFETLKKSKHSERGQIYLARRAKHQAVKENQVDWSAGHHHVQCKKNLEVVSLDNAVNSDDWNTRGKKLQTGNEYRSRNSIGTKISRRKITGNSARYLTKFAQNEETESDSSEQADEDGYLDTLGNEMEFPQSEVVKPVYCSKKASKVMKMDKKVHTVFSPVSESYPRKGKHKGEMTEPSYLRDVKLMKKGNMTRPSEKLHTPLLKSYNAERKRKGVFDLDHSSEGVKYAHNYSIPVLEINEGNLDRTSKLPEEERQTNRSGYKIQVFDADSIEAAHHGRSGKPPSVCNSVIKKPRGKVDAMQLDGQDESSCFQSSPKQQLDEPNTTKKKGRRKTDGRTDSPSVIAPDLAIPEKISGDLDPEKPQKKAFTLITPTIHTGFSFSIIHLLSAVRKAMLTPCTEETTIMNNCTDKDDSTLRKEERNDVHRVSTGEHLFHSHESMNVDSSVQNNMACLTVQEIVNLVRSNPGDPCILETQEPLHDLVRGVLKIFSSKTAPLGAKGWKPLVLYEKSNKSWSWIGPLSPSSSDNETVEEETSSEAWGIPHKVLVKLVDAFANWLKSGQETLQQIGSLPPPPLSILSNLDEKERFKDLRAQKSLNTISPSSDEVRAYFRCEELLRYSVPDRAFSYTAVDGRKSIVAPLRRGGGKPTSKARDHFMLKPDRPPHVTILCLVRDAAARLPGSIGTRADVCTLIRDSQYIVEDVTDAQVNQVVSGALDRLHYERDPCVQFDADRKLWVYLHRDREEEDFEDDGTSSTKKWKRPRKDVAENPDEGAMNDVNCHASGDPAGGGSTGYDCDPDRNVDSSSGRGGERSELVYDNMRTDVGLLSDATPDNGSLGNCASWEDARLKPLRENKILCQENSINEDFDDEAFNRERPIGLLSTSFQ